MFKHMKSLDLDVFTEGLRIKSYCRGFGLYIEVGFLPTRVTRLTGIYNVIINDESINGI
jgi:hypothetical protein